MSLLRKIWVTGRFVGWHRWVDAPSFVGYLRLLHRHEFHVKVTVDVDHGDRAVEFHTLQTCVREYLETVAVPNMAYPIGSEAVDSDMWYGLSCEMVAERILVYLVGQGYAVCRVDVSEDGECGGVVEVL